MTRPYFVMLYMSDGEHAVPLIEENDDVAFFSTRAEANIQGQQNLLGEAFGYEVHEMGGCCDE